MLSHDQQCVVFLCWSLTGSLNGWLQGLCPPIEWLVGYVAVSTMSRYCFCLATCLTEWPLCFYGEDGWPELRFASLFCFVFFVVSSLHFCHFNLKSWKSNLSVSCLTHPSVLCCCSYATTGPVQFAYGWIVREALQDFIYAALHVTYDIYIYIYEWLILDRIRQDLKPTSR